MVSGDAVKARNVQYTACNFATGRITWQRCWRSQSARGIEGDRVAGAVGQRLCQPETKDRVFKAVAESGYRPNLLARNTATKTTQTLGWW